MSSPSMTGPSSLDTTQRRSSVPLSDHSVFIPASPSSSASASRRTSIAPTSFDAAATPDAVDQRPPKPSLSLSLSYDASDVVEASLPSQSPPTSAGAPSTPRATTRTTPRRSRAHQPRLLGLGRSVDEENGVGVSEDVLLTGLGIHAGTPPRVRPKRPSSLALGRTRSDVSATHVSATHDEQQFRIDDGSDDDDEAGSRARVVSKGDEQDGMYSSHANPFRRPSYENDALLFGDDHANDGGERDAYGRDDEDDDDDLEAQHSAYTLPFESITHQERLWMWTSVAFVVALSLVSIAIAADWIDWPGDGIGKD